MLKLSIVRKEDGDILCAWEINEIVDKINLLVNCCNEHEGGSQGDNPGGGGDNPGGDNPGGGGDNPGGDNPGGEESLDTNESIIVFDFLKPWNLNPSIDVPHEPSSEGTDGEVVEVMVTDTTFTNGPVQVYGVLAPDNQSPGDGCSITNLYASSDTYSYAVRGFSGMNVKCSSGYYLKSIEFLGASGEFHPYDSQGGFSTVNNIWKTNSQNITEMKFKTFRLPAYWWQIRVHVVNTESGQTTIDLSPERATLTVLGQDQWMVYFSLEYNDYLKQRCTSSLQAITARREISILGSNGTYGPWTDAGLLYGDAYNYKFIDEVGGGAFLEYEHITNSKNENDHYKRITPNKYRVRYVICRDSEWYDGYDLVLATSNAIIVPAEGEVMYPEYEWPLLWFHNRDYITYNDDGSIIIESEFAASNDPSVIGPYSKYEVVEGSEYITYEEIPASGSVDLVVLDGCESYAIKITPLDTAQHTITIKTICSVKPSVYSTVDVTVNEPKE